MMLLSSIPAIFPKRQLGQVEELLTLNVMMGVLPLCLLFAQMCFAAPLICANMFSGRVSNSLVAAADRFCGLCG